MLTLPKLRELSFLVYGLGISGQSVVKFLKKNKFNDFKVWDDNQKKLFKKYQTLNLKKTLAKVDYIILSPGISLLKNEKLNKYKKKIITDIDLLYLSKNNFKSISKILNHFGSMVGRTSNSKPFSSLWNRWIIYRLNINLEFI